VLFRSRFADYAETSFHDLEPGYGFLRYLGDCVLKQLEESQTNRWVPDHIIEIVAPRITQPLRKAVFDLFDRP